MTDKCHHGDWKLMGYILGNFEDQVPLSVRLECPYCHDEQTFDRREVNDG